nr:LacI family DNA-binding transcriptional regulator [Mycobacterium avium]
MNGPQGNGNSSSNKAARPATADVARLAGVSTATVSYVVKHARGRRHPADLRGPVYPARQLVG